MKRNFTKVLSLILCIVMLMPILGCADKKNKTPEDAIKDAYGDTQFKISFDSSTLSEPLKDVYYSAKNMPVLPTPKKVGFVFAGWYFDSSFTQICDISNNDLLWKMKDLTLYPKWEKEEIFNNGTYEIEFDAEIIEDSIVKGPLAKGYQKFVDDIIKSETYIEKNEKGTFLRIQYDNRVRGPVLGSAGADESNFSKMTYTITEDDGRIDKEISIQDRTNTVQTIYYNIENMDLTDTIILHVEYYNWKIDINDDMRKLATVRYDIKFNIKQFIGFSQSFVNPEGKLTDGIYVIPTHYTKLNKTFAMLDMFNPVYAYIQASGGRYTLYKPLNTYNNDFPEVQPEQFPLRSSGYAREFACFHINQNKKISEQVENDYSGSIYLPEEIGAEKYVSLSYEFHADTGRYYYVVDLGNTLDNDVVFIGGSAGTMESMFSMPVSYRRLVLNYNSMVKIVDWDYKPLTENEYKFKEEVAMYPGSTKEFDGDNTEFKLFQQYRHVIEMTNVFFTRTQKGDVDKIFDTKMTVSVDRRYNNPSQTRKQFSLYNVTYSAFNYNPLEDGDLYAREFAFVVHTPFKHTQSFLNKKMNGKTFEKGATVNIKDLYREKVSSSILGTLSFKAFDVDENLNITGEGYKISNSFTFDKNMAVYCTVEGQGKTESSLIYIVEKQAPKIQFVGGNWEEDRETETFNGSNNYVYRSDKKFEIGSYVDIPEVLYTYYGETYTTKGLKKYFDELIEYGDSVEDQSDKNQKAKTDYTKVSAWTYSQGIYTPLNICFQVEAKDPNDNKKVSYHDFVMGEDNMRVMLQICNQFNEFVPVVLEFEGVQAGRYELELNGEHIESNDITYKGTIRNKINYKMKDTYYIGSESDVYNIPTEFNLSFKTQSGAYSNDLSFKYAIAHLKKNTVKIENIDEIWDLIKDENYAVVSMYYSNDYGDTVEYKAIYNFKVNNKNPDEFFAINKNITVFDGQEFQFKNPFITGADHTILGDGKVKLYKKYGENYGIVDREDGEFYSQSYYTSIKFITSGEYLICWEFELRYDQNGEIVFDSVNPNLEYTYVKFNICQKVEVLNKNTPADLTYATDKNHPFNEKLKQELLKNGYVYSEDENYQYLTVQIRGDKKSFTLTNEYIDSPDYYLFGWGTKDGTVQYGPNNQVQNIIVAQKTLTPILYAVWNVPIEIELTYDFGGVIYTPYDGVLKKMRKDPKLIYKGECGMFRIESFFSKLPDELRGYEIYGWKADKPIFEDYVEIDGHTVMVMKDFVKGDYKKSFKTSESFKITAIFKKTTYIGYEAVKGTPESDDKLKFMEEVESDYKLFVNDNFNEIVSFDKMNQLKNVKVTDVSVSLKYWVAFDKTQSKWEKINLDTFVLEDKYTNANGKITLRAVFG